jgi:uncharacterized membrane protein YGL010W
MLGLEAIPAADVGAGVISPSKMQEVALRTLSEQLNSYAAYHHDPRNRLTHFFGVPLVVFSIFVPLGWFRLVEAPNFPVSGATVFCLVVFVYYLCLDREVALWQAPFSLALLAIADRVSVLPFGTSVAVFGGAFCAGWIIQLFGHVLEGRRPALADNFLQIFNAPLFLTAEVLTSLGYRPDLRAAAEPVVEHEPPARTGAAA